MVHMIVGKYQHEVCLRTPGSKFTGLSMLYSTYMQAIVHFFSVIFQNTDMTSTIAR
jgi:hypothetical protein